MKGKKVPAYTKEIACPCRIYA